MDDLQRTFPFLKGDLLEEFLKHSDRMQLDKGDSLYEEGFPCPFVPFIISGVIRVFKLGESGREITLYRVKEGQICVMSSACSLSDQQYEAIAEAEEPLDMVVIPGFIYRKLVDKYPDLRNMVYTLMAERLAEMMMVVEEVAFKRVDLRLANYLLQATDDSGTSFLETTHAQLAMELGSAREVISRILKDFERKGFVNLVRGKIEVLGRAGLNVYRESLGSGVSVS